MKFFTKTEFRIFLIFWIIFSIFATSDMWQDNSTLDLTMAIADEHRLEIDSYANNTGDRAYYNGHYYSDRVPGTAFLTTPLYKAYTTFIGKIPYYNNPYEDNPSWKYQLFLFLAISLLSAVFGALTVVLVYKISKYFTSNPLHRNLVIIVLGFSTLLPHAANLFTSHAISTFFIFLCFYLIFKMKKEKTDYSLITGLTGGFAVLTDYRTIILLFGFFVIVLTLKKWKWALKFAIGALIVYSILLLYNQAICNSLASCTYVPSNLDESLFQKDSVFLSCGKYTKETLYALNNASRFIQFKGVIIKAFDFTDIERVKRQNGIIIRLLVDPFRGLFFYSPVMLLSFFGLFFMYKKYKAEVLVLLFCFVTYIILLSSSTIWWTGLSFGPRYLTPFIPFFMIPLLYTFKKIDIKIVLFFITISILISIVGLQSLSLSHDPIIFSDSYCEKMKSFAPLANPLFKNYLPSILNYHPKTLQDYLVLERILGFKIVPFANIALLLLAFLFIWKSKSIFKD